ncbi:hypothetical protein Avbf_03372 [Armadillidium vulgare]|nr:hypothetical protein Avbf_03372 [Armadillidium vulgare]
MREKEICSKNVNIASYCKLAIIDSKIGNLEKETIKFLKAKNNEGLRRASPFTRGAATGTKWFLMFC